MKTYWVRQNGDVLCIEADDVSVTFDMLYFYRKANGTDMLSTSAIFKVWDSYHEEFKLIDP